MPVAVEKKKRTIRSLKVGRSIEEVIVKRRLDINNPLSWPPGQPPISSIKTLASTRHFNDEGGGIGHDGVYNHMYKPLITID
jgi:hypothetical protein